MKINKLLLTVVVWLASLGVQAQERGMATYAQASFALNKWTYEGASFKGGYEVMWGFLREMNNDLFLWGMNVGLVSRGTKLDNVAYVSRSGREEFLSGERKFTHHALQLCPFDFNWKKQLGSSAFDINPHVGLNITYDLFGKYKYKCDEAPKEGDEGESKLSDYKDGINQFDIGLNEGVRLWYNDQFFFDLDFKEGFVTIQDGGEVGGNSFRVCFGLGMVF